MAERTRMDGRKSWRTIAGKVYDHVNMALWASLCAVIIFFVLFVAPNVSAYNAEYETDRATQHEIEHDFYCRRWGMLPGTTRYGRCKSDLGQFRRSVEQQVSEELDMLP
jgi:hypothetical protein